MIRGSFLFIVFMAGLLHAQDPAPSPSPSPTVSPSPTPAAPPKSTRQLVSDLKDEEVEAALKALKEGFLNREKVEDKALQRATLEGIIRRLAPGASIIEESQKTAAAPETPFLAEILDAHIGYLRVGALTKSSLAQLDSALASFSEKKIDAVILDLRGVPEGGDFETAADFARRFCPKGKLLFSIQKPSAKQERIFTSNQDPAFQGVLMVLTDANTAGAAEALAATLRLNVNAMIIGAETTGEAVEFSEVPLGGGTLLRVAVAQVILPEIGPIFPEGVKPDVAISLPDDVQAQIFLESKEKGISQFVFETERRRMNEASLVANLNPEIDTVQLSQRDRSKTPQLRDTVLQRAVDLVTAINFYNAKK